MSAQIPDSPFEQIKQTDEYGFEFWSARDLMPLLEYSKWQNFVDVITKAKKACLNSGREPSDHFTDVSNMIQIGKGGMREVADFHLSRYGCYLVVQNADPNKEVVALGQTYFAVQTRRQEVADQQAAKLTEDERRLMLRSSIKQQNVDLASAARSAGVVTRQDFAIFQDHGYKGLYNGLGAKDIHQRKNLKKSQQILDHMSAGELAANLFRTTQAEDKLKRENVNGKIEANQVHFDAGQMVRRAIADFGGTMPEDMPAADSIKKLEGKSQQKLLPE